MFAYDIAVAAIYLSCWQTENTRVVIPVRVNHMTNCEKPVCIVTAASQGIGEVVARELAKTGYRLSLMSRSPQCVTLANEIDGIGMQGSVLQQSDINTLVQKTIDHYGRIDGVVNNTGRHAIIMEKHGINEITPTATNLNFDPEIKQDILSIPDTAWHDSLDLMVLNAVRMARAVTPYLRKQSQSSIVNVSGMESIQPRVAWPLAPVRLALHGFTKIYSDRYGQDGIRMNCVLPGVIRNVDMPEAELSRAIPLTRYGTLEEVAKTIAFLISPDASYITGQLLVVDGGLNRNI